MAPKLAHAQVFFRHGARTPQSALTPAVDWSGTTDTASKLALCERVPVVDAEGQLVKFENVRADGSLTSDVYLQVLSGGAWAGDLTVMGMRDAQALGERLRERYSSLLPETHPTTPETLGSVEVRSTPMRRTIETASGVLSSLLPESYTRQCVIQLNTDDIRKDWMLAEISSPFNAPELRRNFSEGLAAHAASSDAKRAGELCEETERITGWTLPLRQGNWLATLSPACDELRCRIHEGLWEGMRDTGEVTGLAQRLEVELASIFCRAIAGGDAEQPDAGEDKAKQ